MGAPFTEKEKKMIRQSLLEAGNKFATTLGMKKTTVDQLAQYAGISKGAFYKFYATKEELFFEVVEDWHEVIYGAARKAMDQSTGQPGSLRIKSAILASCKAMEETNMMRFFEEDMEHLLRKLPDQVLEEHYHGDLEHIRELVAYSGVAFAMPQEEVAVTIGMTMLLLQNRAEIGPLFDKGFMVILDAVCEKLVNSDEDKKPS